MTIGFDNFIRTALDEYNRFMDKTDFAMFKNPSYLLTIGVIFFTNDKNPHEALLFIDRAIEVDERSGPVSAIAYHYRALVQLSRGAQVHDRKLQQAALADLHETIKLIEERVIPTIHLVGQDHMGTDLGMQTETKEKLWQSIVTKSRKIIEVRGYAFEMQTK